MERLGIFMSSVDSLGDTLIVTLLMDTQVLLTSSLHPPPSPSCPHSVMSPGATAFSFSSSTSFQTSLLRLFIYIFHCITASCSHICLRQGVA